MLLYWGMFTVGFMVGAIFAYQTFAAKNPEEEQETINNRLETLNDLNSSVIFWKNRPADLQSQKLQS